MRAKKAEEVAKRGRGWVIADHGLLSTTAFIDHVRSKTLDVELVRTGTGRQKLGLWSDWPQLLRYRGF